MGNRLDALYDKDREWLTYQQIDEIVKKYKDATDEKARAEQRAALLRAFHKYFMKYVSLLKGTIGNIRNSDTVTFLALFLSGPNKRPTDYVSIYKYIVRVCSPLEEEDIYNELVVSFVDLLDKFEFYPEVSFSRYITKYMRWAIKAWIMEMARNPLSRHPTKFEFDPDPSTEPQVDIDLELPQLDLGWVFESSSPLFDVLTKYERFLLYLNFKEGLGVRQISERLGRAKDTIHAHIQAALQKLRDRCEKGEQ